MSNYSTFAGASSLVNTTNSNNGGTFLTGSKVIPTSGSRGGRRHRHRHSSRHNFSRISKRYKNKSKKELRRTKRRIKHKYTRHKRGGSGSYGSGFSHYSPTPSYGLGGNLPPNLSALAQPMYYKIN